MSLRKSLLAATVGLGLFAGNSLANSEEKLFKVYALWDTPYSCLENYDIFRMHCVRLTEGGGANRLILDYMGNWYYTTDSNQKKIRTENGLSFRHEKAPKGRQFYWMYNEEGQREFFREPVEMKESRKEYCAKQFSFCQNPPKRLPPYKISKK